MEDAKYWLTKISLDENCVAIGECGLDGLVKVKPQIQDEIFLWQIELANLRKKPLIIHCVRKHYELIPFKKKATVPMIVHGFNKNREVATALLAHDFYLSFGKALLQNVSLQQIMKNMPANRFFLETDESEFDVTDLYVKCAEIREDSVQNIENQMAENLQQILK